MKNKIYANEHFWEWVDAHIGQDSARLRLSARPTDDFDVNMAITQVECRTRYAKKLSRTLESFPRFYFPSTLAGEQATGDALASFHQRFVRPDDVLVDLTAGLGIDVMSLARVVDRAFAIERNGELIEALRYNAHGLGVENLTVIEGDSRHLDEDFYGTVAFVDPARRAADGSRVYRLGDCEPNVLTMLPDLREHFDRLVIKASPMLDVARTIADLPGVTDIYLTGTTTECKELDALVDLKRPDRVGEPVIHAVTVTPEGSTVEFDFTRGAETEAEAKIASSVPRVGDLLYEPYPSTMKAGAVKLLSERFGLYKFHANTHLYFGEADKPATGFPGENLEIVAVVPWQSRNLKRFKSLYPRIRVSVRNFGMTAEALRAKLGVADGGEYRLFGIGLGQNHTDRLLIVAK